MTAAMTTPCFSLLLSICRSSFLIALPANIDKIIMKSDDPGELYGELQLIDIIGQTIDTHLDDENTSLLIALCTEDPYFFTNLIENQCIRDNQSAAHVVYHNVYDALKTHLERAWDEYVEEKRGEGIV